MTKPVIVCFPGNEGIAHPLASSIGGELAQVIWHEFPDGETNITIKTPLKARQVIVLCSLDRPDDKLVKLLFCAATAKDLGAARVGLVAPYLAYMRQDRRFAAGQGVTAKYFPRAIEIGFDWLVTVDPHLHRIDALSQVYSIASEAVHAAPAIARWVAQNIKNPVLIGPDGESAQWVQAMAHAANAPFVVLSKKRLGDARVEIDIPDMSQWKNHRPVLMDDIISTGRSMIRVVRGLKAAGLAAPWCIGVHAVFAGNACADLRQSGVAGIVTCNTIRHETNRIDISALLTGPVLRQLAGD